MPGPGGGGGSARGGGGWWRPLRTATAAGGTHPTGMHSCTVCVFPQSNSSLDHSISYLFYR